MPNLSWRTEKRKIADLKFAEVNPRRLTEKQRLDLKASLEKFNLAEIPVIDENNEVLAGNQRLKVLTLLGRSNEEIDVRVPDRPLSKEEKKEYLLRSNKNTGEWDIEALINDFEVDLLTDVGFTADELPGLLGMTEESEQAAAAAGNVEIPEMELKAFEHHDYIVLAFNNTYDWINACQLLGLEKLNASFIKEKKKVGLGRVIDGRKLLELIEH